MNDQFKDVLKKIKQDKIERERKQKQLLDIEIERANKFQKQHEALEKEKVQKEKDEKE